MTLEQIASMGRLLARFLLLFADCFCRSAGRQLLQIYVQGLLSNVQRKNVEAMALDQGVAPRTLQRFLESIKWDHDRVRDRCQQVVATEHSDPEAIGCIDETGTTKSGDGTVGAKRQYNGNRGKIENCVVNVALSFASEAFHCLLDGRLYLPEEWANNDELRQKYHVPDNVFFQTKPQIALTLIDRALSNGITVKAWTFDELYGRDGHFLDGLDQRGQAYVGEIPPNFYVWMKKPRILRKPPENYTGRPRHYPRLGSCRSSQVQHLRRYSRAFYLQRPLRYRIKDTCKGSQVWEIQWRTCWRKTHCDRLVSNQCTLIVARNVMTNEIKYFLSNRVPGRDGWTLRCLLRVAFGRWHVEACFREAKEELGMDHFECRGWQCVHRHLYVTILAQLFCARVREQFSASPDVISGALLTVEQVRRAVNAYLSTMHLPPRARRQAYEAQIYRQQYYQRRNAQAARSHSQTRDHDLRELGVDPARIRSCVPADET